MRRTLLISSLIAILLFTCAPFSGVFAKNVNNTPAKPICFSTEATIIQVPDTANTVPMGGNYGSFFRIPAYQTTGEILVGSLGDCVAWPEISGASIYMENSTYFTLDENYNIYGSDFATITFTVADGSTLKVFASGTLSGNFLTSAGVTLYWMSTGGTGSLSRITGFGRIDATFVWMCENPGATGTFSGTIMQRPGLFW